MGTNLPLVIIDFLWLLQNPSKVLSLLNNASQPQKWRKYCLNAIVVGFINRDEFMGMQEQKRLLRGWCCTFRSSVGHRVRLRVF